MGRIKGSKVDTTPHPLEMLIRAQINEIVDTCVEIENYYVNKDIKVTNRAQKLRWAILSAAVEVDKGTTTSKLRKLGSSLRIADKKYPKHILCHIPVVNKLIETYEDGDNDGTTEDEDHTCED